MTSTVGHLAVDTPFQIPLFATLPRTWRKDLERQARVFVDHDWRVRFNKEGKPQPDDIMGRLRGWAWNQWGDAAPDYATILQVATAAVDKATPTEEGWDRYLAERRVKANRGRHTQQLRRIGREDQIIAARAAGVPIKQVAADLGVSESLVKTRATPAVIAQHRQKVQSAITPPHTDDLEVSPDLKESSESYGNNGRLYLPDSWLLDEWRKSGAPIPSRDRVWKLIRWGDDADQGSVGADLDAKLPNPSDLARLIRWASTARHPWRHLDAEVAKLYALGINGEDNAHFRRSAPDAAVRMVEAPGYVKNPRAYLATSIRNARAAVSRETSQRRGVKWNI